MDLSEQAFSYLSAKLTAAGFTPAGEYTGEPFRRTAPSYTPPYPALISVRKLSLTEPISAEPDSCTCTVTIAARLFGAENGFYDAAELTKRSESLLRSIYFDSEMIVRSATCTEIKRSAALPRLERTLEATFIYSIEKEAANGT